MNIILLVFACIAFGSGVTVLSTGQFSLNRKRELSLAERVNLLVPDVDSPLNLDEIELSEPFLERVIQPFANRIVAFIERRSPAGRRRTIDILLLQAHRKQKSGVILVQQFAAALGIGGFALLLGLLLQEGEVMTGAFALGGLVGGFYLPIFLLKRQGKKRAQLLIRSLPTALDLLTVSMEAGQGLEAAMSNVAKRFTNELSDEFVRTLNEIRLGREREDALEGMALRCNVDEITNLCRAIIQADRLGTGLATMMRVQAADVRRARKAHSQERAQRAPLKMLFPMVGCIFPTIFIVLLGPAIIGLFFH